MTAKILPLHNPDRYMADLRQVLSQGRKRIGLLIGAGAPSSILVDDKNQIVQEGGRHLIRDVAGLTLAVVDKLPDREKQIIEILKKRLGDKPNIEDILTQIRRLAQAIGDEKVHDYDGDSYNKLATQICKIIGTEVSATLPDETNPYSNLVSWISGTQRDHSIEIFTPNYDRLLEEAFERKIAPYFDGFPGSYRPSFDPASVSSDQLPARWSLLWKLHGSLGWGMRGGKIVRTGKKESTEIIYPDHLKYDQVSQFPYSALFARLRQFLAKPDTLLICSGFSFQDSHICAVLDETLAANDHTAILAFQYKPLAEEEPAITLAERRPNMSVYTRDGATIGGVTGYWRLGRTLHDDWDQIRQTFWSLSSESEQGELLLGDFAKLAQFLALTSTSQVTPSDVDVNDQQPSSIVSGTTPGDVDARS